ncbi:hypothetical protein CWB75_06930 [Pseudoalteromonas sp. S1608]|nr:hypothetical protein CWB75_06930 [Pseudoalteromonas sp. S1608]
MEFIKKFKFELITLIVFSVLSVLYYLDTGEVKIVGGLVLCISLLSVLIRLCEKIFVQYRTKIVRKST